MSTPAAIEAAPTSAGPITLFARAVGGLLILLGVLGLVPGITADYDQLGFYRTGAELFGLFATSVVSASVLILLGSTALAFSGSVRQAHKTVCWIGLTFLVVAVAGAGLMVNSPSDLKPVNAAANWLHLVLGVVVLAGAGASRAKHLADNDVF